MHEVKFGLSKEDVTNEISKESCGFKQVYIEEPAGGEPSCDGEFEGMNIKETVETTEIQPREEENCDQEESEVMTVDNALDGVHTESDQMEYEKNLCKTFKNEENVNGDEKEVALPTETLEIIQEDEAIGEGQEDKIKHIEEQLVEEHGQWDQPDEEIVPEICEEVGWTDEASQCALQSDLQTEGKNEEKIPCEKEENACIFNPTTEDRHLGDYDKNAQIAMPMPKEELVIPEDIEVTKDSANEEVAESLELNENKPTVEFVVCHQKGHEDVEKNMGMEVEESSETIDKDTATTKDDLIIETSEDNINNYNEKADKEDLYDKVEDSSVGTRDSSMESNREAIWQAESLQESSMEPQQVKLIDQEVGGKIQEDTAVKEGKHDFQDSQITGGDSSSKLQVKAAECASQKSTEMFPIMADGTQSTDGTGNSEKTFIEKYVVELATPKDHSTNSTWLRMLIWTLFVMSLPSCSWFFGLSFVKNLWVLNSRHA
ncbi:hypothetical protein Pfo_017448 [Paulownia fortunei]|nr:hypothetical protein Pfo_017448 [Paulownia fortunei]